AVTEGDGDRQACAAVIVAGDLYGVVVNLIDIPALGNFAGLPSITLPLTLIHGLPVGINFMGRAFEEKELLSIAEAFEQISGLSGLSTQEKKEARL
ncbi:MAG: amidase family protein, partial [Candidatus Enteromonas sp.]